MSTLLQQLDAAEAELVRAEQRLATVRPLAQPPYNQEMLRSAEVDVMAAAAHAQITAARCLATTQIISEEPDAWRSSTVVDTPDGPMPLANVPAPRARDDLPITNERMRSAGEFLADPLETARRYGYIVPPHTARIAAPRIDQPVASHGVEGGRFAVIHWHGPAPALRIDLAGPVDDRSSTAKPDPGAWDR